MCELDLRYVGRALKRELHPSGVRASRAADADKPAPEDGQPRENLGQPRLREDDGRAADGAERSKALRRLRPALEYIDANYCGRVTLQEAAERVYMSPNYFSHYFHEAADVSFSDYVSLRRIRKARQLLETTGKSIYEIAMECGFPNSSNFYRLYRKHTGESPRQGR